MKLALIGDPHFANRKVFGYPTNTPGVNTRLRAVRTTLEWIANDLKKEKDLYEVAILGDITHDHGKLTPPVLDEVKEALFAFTNNEFTLTLLSGNHDQDANGLSIIPAFEMYDEAADVAINVITHPQVAYYGFDISHSGYNVHAIPYCSAAEVEAYLKTIWGKCSMVLMHHSFQGAKHGVHEFEPPGGINPKDIPDYFQVYSGHYHMRQQIKQTITYIGAPLQHDFGEAHYVPGYVLIDMDGDPHEYEFREVPAEVAPRFHILPHNLDPADVPGLPKTDYYRIDLPSDVDPQSITPLRKSLTNAIIKPIPIDADTRSRVEAYLGSKGEKIEFLDVMAAYAAMNIDEDDRAERVFAVGESIAKSVIGD